MEKVNNYPKDIDLGHIFRNFLWKKKLTFLTIFYIYHESGVKTFLK